MADRVKVKGKVSPVTALVAILGTVVLVTVVGYLIGFSFFWNTYDKDTQAEHNLKIAQQRVKTSPADIDAQIALGEAYFALGQVENAQKVYQQALQLDKQNPVARYNLCLITIQQGDFNSARQELEGIKKDAPKYLDARATLGSVYFQLHEYKLAIAELETVNAFQPGNVNVLTKLAEAYVNNNQKDKAKTTYQEALKYNPTDKQLQQALQKLQ